MTQHRGVRGTTSPRTTAGGDRMSRRARCNALAPRPRPARSGLVLFAVPYYAQTETPRKTVAQGETIAATTTRDARVTQRRARA
jgi:hypothetical protein